MAKSKPNKSKKTKAQLQRKKQRQEQKKRNLARQANELGIKNTSDKSITELKTIITAAQEKENQKAEKEKQKAEKVQRQRERRAAYKQQLLDAGFLPHEIKAHMYSSQKTVNQWIELRRLQGEQSVIKKIDWFSKRSTGKGFYIAFKDMSENFTLDEIIRMYSHMTPEELVAELNRIKNVPLTFTKRAYKTKAGKTKYHTIRKSKSSGKAGICKYQYAPPKILMFNQSRRRGWQTLNFEKNKGWYDFTLYKVTAAITAIMNHIVETERQPLYHNFYVDICEIEPLMAEVLDKP